LGRCAEEGGELLVRSHGWKGDLPARGKMPQRIAVADCGLPAWGCNGNNLDVEELLLHRWKVGDKDGSRLRGNR
jgi:hypothetical protein